MASPSSVLIIGAGAAGLAAAKSLSEDKIQVLVLEGRDRIGGRVHTLREPGSRPLDVGAEFVHGRGEAIREILSGGFGHIRRLKETHACYWRGVEKNADTFWPKALHLFKKMRALPFDRPILEFVRDHEGELADWEQALILDYLEGFNAAELSEMSELAQVKEDAGPGVNDNSRVIEGYDKIFDSVQRLPNVEIRLRHRVKSVEWKIGEVKVTSETPMGDRVDYVQAVILTVPCAVFAEKGIHFTPELPLKTEAARRIALGPVYKLVFDLKHPLWEARTDIEFLHSPELSFGTRWVWGLYDSRILTSWCAGGRARRFGLRPCRDFLIDRAIGDLCEAKRISRSEIESAVQRIAFHDWQADEFSQGAYSYVKVGGYGAREELARPLDGTLFFAGEATMSDGNAGTVHGALRSGQRAARQLRLLAVA